MWYAHACHVARISCDARHLTSPPVTRPVSCSVACHQLLLFLPECSSLSPNVAARTYCTCNQSCNHCILHMHLILHRIFIFIHHTQDWCAMFVLYGVGQEANRIAAHIMRQASIPILGSAMHSVRLCLSVRLRLSLRLSLYPHLCLLISVSSSLSLSCSVSCSVF